MAMYIEQGVLLLQIHRLIQQDQAQDLHDLLQIQRNLRNRRRRQRSVWVRPWLLRREAFGHYNVLMQELATESESDFINFMRMDPRMFAEVVERVTPRIQRQDTNFRRALEPGLKVAVTLRHFASGQSYRGMAYNWRVAHNTISKFIKEVSDAIVAEYAGEVVVLPATPEEWQVLADQFGARWNFSHAIGAIDGKHVRVKKPPNSGSVFYNYKHYFSILLLALVDADYKFLYVEVGANGSCSDCQVFNQCELKLQCEEERLGLPPPQPLRGDDHPIPYFIVGDDAFPLRPWLMKPYSKRNLSKQQRIFNYRLSRARRIVENAFGILVNRFQCLLHTREQAPEVVESITLACCCLHNLMRMRYPRLQNNLVDHEDDQHNVIPGAWREGENLDDIQRDRGGNIDTSLAKDQRDYLMHYYNGPGAVTWQDRMIT